MQGVQLSGVFNTSKNLKGLQISSILNVAEDVEGLQIGLLNFGKKVDGLQIGLVNISDEMHGIPLGLINISGNGLNDLSAWYRITSYNVCYTKLLRDGDDRVDDDEENPHPRILDEQAPAAPQPAPAR